MTSIPYLYNNLRKNKRFMVSDFNEGLTLCLRLGFDPVLIELGRQEAMEMSHWNYPLSAIFPIINVKESRAKSKLVYHCKKWNGQCEEEKSLIRALKAR